jgi:hypothetical protein
MALTINAFEKSTLKLGDITVICRSSDGYINATKLCEAGGKRIGHWLANESSRELINEISSVVGIPTTELLKKTQGGIPKEQGTWVHRDLAIHIAMWVSPKFGLLVNEWHNKRETTGSTRINIGDILTSNSFVKELLDATDSVNVPISAQEIIEHLLGNNENAIKIYNMFGHKNFNKCWIYISDAMKLEYLTNEKGDWAINNVNKRIISQFDDEECRNIKKEELKTIILLGSNLTPIKYINLPSGREIDKDHGNTLYTLATGECFKLMLMMARTDAGNKVRQYFIKIEEGFNIVAEYLIEIERQKLLQGTLLLQQRNTELEKEKLIIEEKTRKEEQEKYNAYRKRIQDIHDILPHTKLESGWVYIITSMDPNKNFIWKIGQTSDINTRLSSLRTSDNSIECYRKYQVNDKDLIEHTLHRLLNRFRVWKNKEWFYIYNKAKMLQFIENIINNINDGIDDNNLLEMRERYLTELELNIPVSFEEDETPRSRTPTKTRSKSPGNIKH